MPPQSQALTVYHLSLSHIKCELLHSCYSYQYRVGTNYHLSCIDTGIIKQDPKLKKKKKKIQKATFLNNSNRKYCFIIFVTEYDFKMGMHPRLFHTLQDQTQQTSPLLKELDTIPQVKSMTINVSTLYIQRHLTLCICKIW